MPEVGDHYRPAEKAGREGVYRVVGTDAEITLLRVTDGNGRRVHAGELHREPPGTLASEYEPAADPDAGLSPLGAVRNLLQGIYWEGRKFL